MKKYYLVASFFLTMVLVLPLVGNAANSTFSSFTIDNVSQGDTLYKGVSSVSFRWEGSTLSGSQADILMCPQSLAGQLINGAVLGRCFYLDKNFPASDKHRTLTIPETTPTGQSLRDVRVQFVLRDTHSTNCSDAEGCLRIFYNSCGAGRSCLISGYLNLATANDNARVSSISVPPVIKAGQSIPSAVVQAINNGSTIWKDLVYDTVGDYSIGVWASLGLDSTPVQDSNLFGSHRYSLRPEGSTVSPGSFANFYPIESFTAPTTPGIYRLKFQMVREHVNWFGTPSIIKDIMVIPNNVTGIMIGTSTSTSSSWYRTESKTVSWSTANFHSSTRYDVYFCQGHVPSSICFLLKSNLSTGSLSKARVPGDYPSSLSTGYIKVVAKNLGTGVVGDTSEGFSDGFNILAEAPVDNAEIVSVISIPDLMKTGATAIYAKVTAKNTGNTTWTNLPAYTNGDYSIGVLGSVGAASSSPLAETNLFGRIRFDMVGNSVAPLSIGNFSPATIFTAPTTPGVYRLQFQMVKEGVKWFGAKSAIKTITVVPSSVTGISVSKNEWPRTESNVISWSTTGFPSGTKYHVQLCSSLADFGSGCSALKSNVSASPVTVDTVPVGFTSPNGYIRIVALVPGMSNILGLRDTAVVIKSPSPTVSDLKFCGPLCSQSIPDTGSGSWNVGGAGGAMRTIIFKCSNIPAGKYFKVYFTASDNAIANGSATTPTSSTCSGAEKTARIIVQAPPFYSSSNSADNGWFRIKLAVTNDEAGNQLFSTLPTLSTAPFRLKYSGTMSITGASLLVPQP